MTELVKTIQNSSDEELLPCPFCGGNPIEDFEREELGGDKVGRIINWSVYCTKCYAGVFSCESQEDAQEKWNRRVKE